MPPLSLFEGDEVQLLNSKPAVRRQHRVDFVEDGLSWSVAEAGADNLYEYIVRFKNRLPTPLNLDALLPRHEGKADPQLQDEVLHLPHDRVFDVFFEVSVLQTEEIEDVGISENQIRR